MVISFDPYAECYLMKDGSVVLVIPESELVDGLMNHLVENSIAKVFLRSVKISADSYDGFAAVRSGHEIPVEPLRPRESNSDLVETTTEESSV
jgi:hypothetical protein